MEQAAWQLASAYLVVSGLVANVGGGITQLAGAATGNIKGGEEGANAALASGTVLGFGTLVLTGGNVNAAGTAGRVEGLALAPLLAGLGIEPPPGDLGDLGDAGQSAIDLLKKDNEPNPVEPKCKDSCPK